MVQRVSAITGSDCTGESIKIAYLKDKIHVSVCPFRARVTGQRFVDLMPCLIMSELKFSRSSHADATSGTHIAGIIS